MYSDGTHSRQVWERNSYMHIKNGNILRQMINYLLTMKSESDPNSADPYEKRRDIEQVRFEQ